jgi:hypothetical protein
MATNRKYMMHDWTLTGEQMIYFLKYNNLIEAAYSENDMKTLRILAASDEFKAIFGNIRWDEAYDRYESMILENSNSDA